MDLSSVTTDQMIFNTIFASVLEEMGAFASGVTPTGMRAALALTKEEYAVILQSRQAPEESEPQSAQPQAEQPQTPEPTPPLSNVPPPSDWFERKEPLSTVNSDGNLDIRDSEMPPVDVRPNVPNVDDEMAAEQQRMFAELLRQSDEATKPTTISPAWMQQHEQRKQAFDNVAQTRPGKLGLKEKPQPLSTATKEDLVKARTVPPDPKPIGTGLPQPVKKRKRKTKESK